MKKTLLLAGIFALSLQAHAQKTFKKAFSASGKQKIVLQISKSNLTITGYTGNEIIIECTEEMKAPPERAKGLKPLFQGATDNTGIGLEVQEASGTMTIKKATFQEIDFTIKVPAGADINLEEDGWESDNFTLKDLSGEIEVEAKSSSIKFENVTGPVVANTVNGDVDIIYGRVNQSKPSHISVINGHLDVTLPADTKANLDLSAINGQVYSDFEIKFPENEKGKGLRQLSWNNTSGTINGGGVELSLNAINNNIYIRKK